MRKSFVICDWCETKKEDEGKVPEGWGEVKLEVLPSIKFDNLHFCSKQCMCSFIDEELELNEKNEEYAKREEEMLLKQKQREEQILLEQERSRQQEILKRQEMMKNRTQRIEIEPDDVHSTERVEEVSNPDRKKRFGFFG